MMKHKNKLISISLAAIMLVSMVAVVSLSASAAPTVSSPLGSAPAVVDPKTFWVFVKGSDGNFYYTKDGFANPIVWSAVPGLGAPPGGITSDPTVVLTATSWNIFVRGGNGGLYVKSSTDGQTGSAWSDWSQVSAGTVALAAGTGPGAYWYAPDNMLGVFYVGTSNELEYIYLSGGSWSSPQNLGGYVSTSPSAVATPRVSLSGTVDVFVRGQSGGLWQITYATGGFGPWSEVPGNGYLLAGTGPSAVSLYNGELDVFVTGGSGGLWQQHYGLQTATATVPAWQTATTGGAYTPLGGVLTASPAAAPGSGVNVPVQLFVRGGSPNQQLYSRIGGSVLGSPTVYTWAAYQGPANSPV